MKTEKEAAKQETVAAENNTQKLFTSDNWKACQREISKETEITANNAVELMKGELTNEQAREIDATGWFNEVAKEEAARAQLYQPRLCMPFRKFHEAIEFLLGRPVFTHEFAASELLKAEAEKRVEPCTAFVEVLKTMKGGKKWRKK